ALALSDADAGRHRRWRGTRRARLAARCGKARAVATSAGLQCEIAQAAIVGHAVAGLGRRRFKRGFGYGRRWWCGLAHVSSGWQRAHHRYAGANLGQLSQVQHGAIEHAKAAGGLGLADRLYVVGAVDAVERIAEVERHGTERVLGAAGHLFGKPWVAFAHFGGRIPVGARFLSVAGFPAGPVEALWAHRLLAGGGARGWRAGV